MGKRQAATHDWAEGRKWWTRTIGIDRSSLKNENVLAKELTAQLLQLEEKLSNDA
jgi:hypothetical protein